MDIFKKGSKTQSKRIVAFTTAVLFSASLMFSGCIEVLRPTESTDNEVFPSAPVLTVSDSEYTMVEKHISYPEGADDDTAQYLLTYSVPVFSENVQYAKEMNTSISMFEAELMKRVEDERLPYADRVEGQPAPYTRVECEVTSARGFVNAVFSESYGYADDEQVITHSVVMRNGKRVGLAAASGAYDAETRAAQQILNIIENDGGDIPYYNDLILDDVISAIDLYSGFYAVDEGYTLICGTGILAPESYGDITFTIATESMYPDVVGDLITVSEYEKLSPVTDCLAYAAYINGSGFTSGNPDSVLSTAFMLTLVNNMQYGLDGLEVMDDGALYMERDAFLNLFGALFDGQFKADEQGAVEETEDGFILRPADKYGEYHFSLSDVVSNGDTLLAVGEIMYGNPDGSNSRLSGAELTLKRDTASLFGFKLVSLEFN